MKNKYLLIRNAGIAPLESYTILGLSTARGSADKIGQFGSGSKHGILTLMRHNIPFRIFLGSDELTFSLHKSAMNGKEYQEVRFNFRNEQHRTGTCLDFGALDWTEPGMALREFICNALDQGEHITNVTSLCPDASSHAGETRIFVELTKEVIEYHNKIKDFFLHFSGTQNDAIQHARSRFVQLYRRGVHVKTVEDKQAPLFLYNFTDERIDEARNMDGANIKDICAKMLCRDINSLEQLFLTFGRTTWFETNIGLYSEYYNSSVQHNILSAWKKVHGDKPFVFARDIAAKLETKKIEFVLVPEEWSVCLRVSGVPAGSLLLSELEMQNYKAVKATANCIATFDRVWAYLECINMTMRKEKPAYGCFTTAMSSGGEKLGLYQNGVCYLNLDYDTNEQTALEELAHYITGASDETRDFQDFAFKCASRFAKVLSV